jgi:hypothetical protein
MTLEDLCFEVCTALNAAGARAVLTGGSAATFYAPHVYQSFDADFVIAFGNSTDAAKALEQIGFVEKNGAYHRKGTKYTVEFPAGPPAIGSEYITDYATVTREDQVLHVLHQIDCVRDRLLWFYHYGDFSALNAAVGIAEANAIDMAAIRAWSQREHALDKFEFFNRQIAYAERRGSETKALTQ